MRNFVAQSLASTVYVALPDASTMPAPVAELKTACSCCHVCQLCFPCGLASCDLWGAYELKFGRRRVEIGQALYREGDRFQSLYAVRSGTFKSSLMLSDGREQVNAFVMAGEMMGLDGVAYGFHASSVTALEDAEVCVIPYALLTEMSAGKTDLQQLVTRLMSQEILRENSLMMMLGSMAADERLAAFLLNLSYRLKVRGYSASEFHLRMSRAEIGSYLGMTLETVSRTFSAFQQLHLLDVDRRYVRIIDPDGLARTFGTRLH